MRLHHRGNAAWFGGGAHWLKKVCDHTLFGWVPLEGRVFDRPLSGGLPVVHAVAPLRRPRWPPNPCTVGALEARYFSAGRSEGEKCGSLEQHLTEDFHAFSRTVACGIGADRCGCLEDYLLAGLLGVLIARLGALSLIVRWT